MSKRTLGVVCSIVLAASVAFAHHSVSAEFDTSKTVTINGTICSIEFSIPHSHAYVHVRMNNGQAETWKVTLPPPHLWGGANVAKDLFKAGESMTVEAHPSKTSSTPRSKPELFYSACPSQLANNLQSGYPRVIMLSGGRQVRISEEQPATVSVRFF